jgi:hypothetical protein
MRKFIASMSYDLSPETAPDARKLLRAELVGRRWKDRCRERLMPKNSVWIERSVDDEHTTSDVHDRCAEELQKAVAAVAKTGRSIRVLRAWVQVAGAGSYGLIKLGDDEPSDD